MKKVTMKILTYLVLLVIIAISIGPFLWVLIGSFKTNKELFSAGAFSLPQTLQFNNYVDAVKIAPIGTFFCNSVIVCLGNTLLSVFIVSAFAYVMARFRFRGQGFLIALITSALMLPSQSISQPIFSMYKSFGLFDTKTGLILVYLALSIPVTFYIMRSYFLSIPHEIEESAYIDGAGFLRTYWSVVLPLAKPGMATAAIIQFLNSWNEFYFALVLTSGVKARTVPIALNYYTSQFSSNYPAMFSAVVLTVVPTIIFFVAAQEQIVDSLAAGAVKG